MVKKKELSKDEKLKIKVWTVAGVITAEVAACLGHGELTICRLRAELKELLAGVSPPPPHFWSSQDNNPC
jgi:hypothetical protein